MTTATRSIALAAAVVAALATPARAQSAEAESLFQQGKRLMNKGQVAQACDKFEAADRVEATASTELNLADCREKNGQRATAWAMFIKAATTAKRAGDGKRAAEGRRRAALLEPTLVYLTIIVPEEARIDGLVVKRNDAAIDEALWNQRVPVDPDEYTISAEAPGYKPWSTSVVVKTKSKKVVVPVLDKRPEPRREARRAEATRSADDGDRTERAEPRDRERSVDDARPSPRDRELSSGEAHPAAPMTGKRKWSIALAAVGVAAIGAGVGLGVHANKLEDEANRGCSTTLCNTQEPVSTNLQARHYALGANIGFATGGALVVGAAVLWFLGAPRSPEAVSILPTLDRNRVGIGFARSF
jgi:hypothetical protein